MKPDLLSVAAGGMDAQRAALDVAARNVAGAEAAGAGGSYDRQVPQFSIDRQSAGSSIRFTGTKQEKGTSVDLLLEMIAVMRASRAYEANASVFDLGKRLAERTIDVERL